MCLLRATVSRLRRHLRRIFCQNSLVARQKTLNMAGTPIFFGSGCDQMAFCFAKPCECRLMFLNFDMTMDLA